MPDRYRIQTSGNGVAVVASTQKTILGYNGPAASRVLIDRWGVDADAGASGDAPPLARLMRSSTAGTATAVTGNPTQDSAAPADPGTAGENYTAEPTLGIELDRARWPIGGGGLFDHEYPLGMEKRLPVSGRAVIVITPGAQGRTIGAWMEYAA